MKESKKAAGNNNRKDIDNERVVGITLYPDDHDCIEVIKKAHGLLRDTDCIRLALRHTAKLINTEQQAA